MDVRTENQLIHLLEAKKEESGLTWAEIAREAEVAESALYHARIGKNRTALLEALATFGFPYKEKTLFVRDQEDVAAEDLC